MATKSEVTNLLDEFHYIGAQCADPMFIFAWRTEGGLFGDYGEPIAAALFSPPASFVWGAKSVELVRLVRADSLELPLSKFIAKCLRFLKSKQINLVVAYADPEVGHHGGIYQSCNFIYVGKSSEKYVFENSSGRRMSQRCFDQSRERREDWTKKKTGRKFTYVYPLTRNETAIWFAKRLPYPKPNANSMEIEGLK